jgi:hypothetical protein
MLGQETRIGERPVKYWPIRQDFIEKLAPLCFYLFLTITAVALFIPLNPRMPADGLDASWQFGMNEAVARGMSFGKEVVFTYGPYASICTQSYHPATDGRMMWGSLLLAVSYVSALLFLSRKGKRYILIILLLFLATIRSSELLLLSFSFLLPMCILSQLEPVRKEVVPGFSWWQKLTAGVMWSTLGLLPVIKGSLLLPFAASVGISSALVLHRVGFKKSLALLFIPIAAAIAFWILAGQSLLNLPAYLHGTMELTSGYTEAMSTSWAALPSVVGDGLVVSFVSVVVAVFWSISRAPRLVPAARWMLAILTGVFALVVFKHGFIATAAATGAFSSFAAFLLIIGFLYIDRALVWSVLIMMILATATSITRDTVLTNEVHNRFGVGTAWSGGERLDILRFCVRKALPAYSRMTYKSTWNTYREAWGGLRARIIQSDDLTKEFAKAKGDIADKASLPVLTGNVDFYEYDQSILLASDNRWNPRPVIQSYSAYTPTLARLNEQHLRSQDAPDWIVFDLQSIDNRFPSLDDGVSWPALLDNYTLDSFDGHFVFLRRNTIIQGSSNYAASPERHARPAGRSIFLVRMGFGLPKSICSRQ